MKQNKALRNRTASAIHLSLPCFPDARGLLAIKWYLRLDPLCVTSQVLCLCQVVGTHPDFCFLSEIYFE